jgi:hypothetical protein
MTIVLASFRSQSYDRWIYDYVGMYNAGVAICQSGIEENISVFKTH